MDMNCEGWLCKLGEQTMEKALKTLSDMLDDADKTLDSDEITDIHHLWEIIRDVKMMTKKDEE